MGVEILSSDMVDTVTFDQVLPWRLLRRYRHKELQKGTLTDEVGAVPTYVSSLTALYYPTTQWAAAPKLLAAAVANSAGSTPWMTICSKVRT